MIVHEHLDPNISETDLQDSLLEMRSDHVELLQSLKSVDNRPHDALSHLLIAVLRRSLALMDGFLLLVARRNRYCAVPLIRLQLDNAMRIVGLSLVADPTDYIRHMLEGNELRKYKCKEGRSLTDSRLHEELTKRHSAASAIYRDTCGYVHFSNHHLFGVFDFDELITGDPKYADPECLPEWPLAQREGAIVNFIWATDALIAECRAILASVLP